MNLRRTITRMLHRAADAFESNGSNGGRRWPSWAMGSAPARQQLATRYRDAARGNWLAASSPSGNAIAEAWAVNLVGDGPSVRSGHPNEAMREALENEFAEWGKAVDIEGMHDLAGFLLAVVRSIVMAGEAVVQMVTTPRGELRLRLLSPEQLDPALNREVEDLRRILAGVEFSLTGERIAYHVANGEDAANGHAGLAALGKERFPCNSAR